ncbi:MAG TPA: efflux RND transporter periplasmic adaptor subunit [Candidatus Binataceae bacterium]|nr:efflux RND transporter periplasmic adaptor subunit [Candidatus Binataceae bacterium]
MARIIATISNRFIRASARQRIAIALAAFAIVWIGWRLLGFGKIRPGLFVANTTQNPDARTATVTREKLPIVREVIGSIQSRIPVDASSRIAARVMQVRVRAGDRVKPGDLLVELDTSDVNAQVAAARGDLSAAQAELNRTQADQKKFSSLYSRGSVTERERDAADAAYQAAQGRMAQAQAAVAAAQGAIDYASVRSTVNGIVVERMVEPGDMAMPGKPLVKLYDESALRAELEVPEDAVRTLTLGTPLDVCVDATGKQYRTAIDEIVPEANAGSRSFLVRAAMPSDQHLTPGMFVRASFTTGSASVLTIPSAAVQEIGQLETVRVFYDGREQTRMVSLGRSTRERVEVLAGVNEGEKIVLPEPQTVRK